MASPKLVRAPDAVVAAVPPLAMASVADSPAAVPVVFWFRVGTSAAWMAARAAFVPLLRRYVPAVCVPVRAVMAAAAVVCPVPPFAMATVASVSVIAVVPDPEASPLTVMVWLPDRYDPVSSAHVSAAVFLRNPVVAVSAAMAAKSPSYACTSNPMASPKLLRASAAVVAFVPPLAMTSVDDRPAAVVALVAFPESAP